MITLFVCIGLVLFTLIKVDGDILQFVVIGTRFSEGDPNGSEGYDGQFGYYIALKPAPQDVARHLDVPAYRYQRIVLPMLARIFSLGNPDWIAWWLVILPLLGQVLGVSFVSKMITDLDQSPWLALIYGLNAGCLLSIRTALPEPLAYGFVAAALYAYFHRSYWVGALMLWLAYMTKEVSLLFGMAVLVWLISERQWKGVSTWFFISFLPWIIWQGWLWRTFGQMGIGSGGAGATGFEWIPFMGLLRIATYSWQYFLAMLIVFSPYVVVPSIWGAWASLQKLLLGERNLTTIALFFHCLMMFSLPFSTYRETGGILRLSVGFVLAFLLFVVQQNKTKILRYLPFWWVYNVFLLR
jgi:hypothetical protein